MLPPNELAISEGAERRREVNAKDAKDKNHRLRRLAQIFFCVLCKFLCPLWFSPSIGVNLCQSVDKIAKDKIHRLHRLAQIFSVFSVNFCVLCGFLLQLV